MSQFSKSYTPSAPPFEICSDTSDTHSTCPVCINDIGNNNFVITKCNHKICIPCLMANYNKSLNGHLCPMCRSRILDKRRNIYVAKSRINFEATNLLFNMFDDQDNMFPLFKELTDFVSTRKDNISEFKEIFGRFIMTEFINNYTTNLNITK